MQTQLDDLATSIGFNSTLAIVAWFGDSKLYVPTEVSETHILHAIIGGQAFATLVADFGGEAIWVSDALIAERTRRDKEILEKSKFLSTQQIADETGLGLRRVQKILKKFNLGNAP